MHEFSLATELIQLAQREMEKNMAASIQEITIEVGDLSGVDADAFETAMDLLSKDSVLDKSRITIIRSPGKGKCNVCKDEFGMTHRLDFCPKCRCFPSEICGGEEFRVVSLIVE